MSGAFVRTVQGEQSFVPAEKNGIIRLETLQMMVKGAVGLTFECNGKMVPVSKRGKELLTPMDGWGNRVYSVISEAPGGRVVEKKSRDPVEVKHASPTVEILQDSIKKYAEECAKRENQMKFSIAASEEEIKRMVKQERAMKSLLENAGVGSGEDIDQVVKAVVLSQEEEEEKVGGRGSVRDFNLQSCLPPAYSYNPRMLQRGAVWDSHCHLDILASRLQRVGVRRGEYLEVTLVRDGEGLEDKFGGCVANFCDPRSWAEGREGRGMVEELRSCMAQSRVFLAIGCHPRFADRFGSLQLQQLELLAREKKGGFVAIGECGLDLSQNNKLSLTVQKKAFSEQVSLALRLELPLVLHIREAEREGRQLLQELGVPPSWPMHRHCFKGLWKEAESWLELFPGSKIGLTGVVTNANAKAVHEVAKRVPLDRLLLETDAPYFLPAKLAKSASPYSYQFSQPGQVIHVAAQVAALRGVSLVEVLDANRRNIEEVYGIAMKTKKGK